MTTRKRQIDPEVLMSTQMRSIPALNAAVKVQELNGGRKLLIAPLDHRGWTLIVKRIFPVRSVRKIEIDRLSAELLKQCDGNTTVGEIIERHQARWKLSFFEARGMVLEFLKQMVRNRILLLVVPELSRPPALRP